MHVYEVRPRKDKRGVDLISEALNVTWSWRISGHDVRCLSARDRQIDFYRSNGSEVAAAFFKRRSVDLRLRMKYEFPTLQVSACNAMVDSDS
jgi:hypothetical protein